MERHPLGARRLGPVGATQALQFGQRRRRHDAAMVGHRPRTFDAPAQRQIDSEPGFRRTRVPRHGRSPDARSTRAFHSKPGRRDQGEPLCSVWALELARQVTVVGHNLTFATGGFLAAHLALVAGACLE
jgi:hypothetical protein